MVPRVQTPVLAILLTLITTARHEATGSPESPTPRSTLTLEAELTNHQRIFLVRELVGQIDIQLTIQNKSERTVAVSEFEYALMTGAISIEVTNPDKKSSGRLTVDRPLDPAHARDWHRDIKSNDTAIGKVKFANFRYYQIPELTGEYDIKITYQPRPKAHVLNAQPIKIRVISLKKDDILSSHFGDGKYGRPDGDTIPIVQQIAMENKVYLYYCVAAREKGIVLAPSRYMRLTELPQQTVLTVSGTYGSGKPITITYKDPKSPTGTTKLVINSVDGSPWTAEDEAAYQQRLKKMPPAKP